MSRGARVVAAGLLVTVIALAYPVAVRHLDRVIAAADLVVAGVQISDAPVTPGTQADPDAPWYVTFVASRALKGVVRGGSAISVYVASARQGLGWVGDSEIAALKREPSGRIVPAADGISFLPWSPGDAHPELAPVDEVVRDLGDVVLDSREPFRRRWNAMIYLSSARNREATAALLRTFSGAPPLYAKQAAYLLLARNQPEPLHQLRIWLSAPDALNDDQRINFGNVIANLRDRRAIPDLEQLATNDDARIRRGAQAALRAMKSPVN